MTRQAIYRKKRYRTDAAWRAARLAEMRVYYATRKDHPVFKELVKVRAYIHHKREALERMEARVSKTYEAIERLIQKRDTLVKEWKEARSRRKAA